MRLTFIALTATSILLSPLSSSAFNSYGHMSVAYVAYQKLTPQLRDKANALLPMNPDFPNWVAKAPVGTAGADKDLRVFMIAATWADRIKSATGFHEDDPTNRNKCSPVSVQNTGFTDPFRHRRWHFIDVAFTQDGTTTVPATPVPNAQERVELFRPVLASNNDDLKAYDLSWLLHLVGDLHQPLHCTTRVGQGQLDGDAGDYFAEVIPGESTVKLHAFWDDSTGVDRRDPKSGGQNREKAVGGGCRKANDLNVGHWVTEGVQNARDAVYVAPVGLGVGPLTLTKKYQKAAKALAKKQVAPAGERLANLLNAELK